MTRMLTTEDVEAGLVGGLFLSAGGSEGMRSTRIADWGRWRSTMAAFRLVALDELDPDALIITATAVGAPGFANWAIKRAIHQCGKAPYRKAGAAAGRRHLRARPRLQCVAGRGGART